MVCELIRPHSLHHSLEYFLVPVAFRLVVNEVEADLPIGQGDLALDVNGRTLLQHCRITFRALEVGAPIERPVWEKTCEVSTRRCDASLWLAQYTHARAQH